LAIQQVELWVVNNEREDRTRQYFAEDRDRDRYPGRRPVVPLLGGPTFVLSTDGITAYDTANNLTWLADADFAASNRFGLPACNGSGTRMCINASGSMSYQAAAAWVQAMNAANYLGHTNWQLPTTPSIDKGCPFMGQHGNSFGFVARQVRSVRFTTPRWASRRLIRRFHSETQPGRARQSENGGYVTFSFNTGFHGTILPQISSTCCR